MTTRRWAGGENWRRPRAAPQGARRLPPPWWVEAMTVVPYFLFLGADLLGWVPGAALVLGLFAGIAIGVVAAAMVLPNVRLAGLMLSPWAAVLLLLRLRGSAPFLGLAIVLGVAVSIVWWARHQARWFSPRDATPFWAYLGFALVCFVISLPSLSVPSPAFWKPAAFAFGAGAFGAATAKLAIRVALTPPEPPGR